MIPGTGSILNTRIKVKSFPGLQHAMETERNRIIGTCDGLPAVRQTIFKILNTERYAYAIYSWNYGVELSDLYGEPAGFVYPEVERRITEALMQDDRIRSVDSFSVSAEKKGSLRVSFTVHTVYGDIEAEKAVNY